MAPANDERRRKIINCILLRKDELAKTTQSDSGDGRPHSKWMSGGNGNLGFDAVVPRFIKFRL